MLPVSAAQAEGIFKGSGEDQGVRQPYACLQGVFFNIEVSVLFVLQNSAGKGNSAG